MSLPPLRPPILSPTIEAKLKRQLTPLWEEGLTGPEIARALKFGEGDYEDCVSELLSSTALGVKTPPP